MARRASGRGLRRPSAPPLAAAAAVLLAGLALLALGPSGAAAAKPETKGAKITLRAKWQGTPLLHEAAEFLADEDPSLFWRFVEDWQARSAQLPAQPSPEQCWSAIRSVSSAHLSPAMARLFDASLAARQYSAKLEAFRQLAKESQAELAAEAAAGGGSSAGAGACCWALLGGRAYTEPGPLEAALAAALAAQPHEVGGGAGAVYPFDHVYGSPDALSAPPLNITGRGTVPVELFAPIGSRCGADLHAVLSAAVASSDKAAVAAAAAGSSAAAPPRLAYAWRPLLDDAACSAGGAVHACTRVGTEGQLVLPGYGVEMALKNMEYNAQDDSKQASSKAAEAEGSEEEAAAESGEEAEHEGDDGGVMEIKMKNLGLQAAQRVLNAAGAPGHDPLLALQEIAQDFPRLARHLSAHKYGKSLRTAAEALQRFIPPGAQFLLINGMLTDVRDLSLFELLDTLRREVRLYDALEATGLPPAQLRQALLLRGASAGENDPPRLRLPLEDGVVWVNDIENDDKYWEWPRDLQGLLQPTFPGRLPVVRRNLITAVYLFDPATRAGLEIVATARSMDQQMWPMRFGLVPVVPARAAHVRGGPGPKSADAPSLSEKMARLLALVHRTWGGALAADFASEVKRELEQLPEAEAEKYRGDDEALLAARLWPTAEAALARLWEGWVWEADTSAGEADGERPTAAQVLEQAAAPGDGTGGTHDIRALRFLETAAELAVNSGLAGLARSGVLVLNGAVNTNDGGGSGWQSITVQAMQPALQQAAEDIYMQRLVDASSDLLEDILSLRGSISRYNPRILPLDAGGPGYIKISGETEEYASRQLALTGPGLSLKATGPHQGGPLGPGLWVRYFGHERSLVDEEEGAAPDPGADMAAVTHWVVADVASRRGLQLVAAALQHRSGEGRLAVLVNAAAAGAPGVPAAQQLLPIERLLVAAASGLFETNVNDFADQLDAVLQPEQAPGELTMEQLDAAIQFGGHLGSALDSLAGKLPAAAANHLRFIRGVLKLPAGANAVVTNGRLIELPSSSSSSIDGGSAGACSGTACQAPAEPAGPDLEPKDFELLELFAQRNQFSQQVAGLVRAALQAGALGSADPSTVAAAASAALAAYKPEDIDGRSSRVAEIMGSMAQQRNYLHIPPPPTALSGEGGSEAAAAERSPLLVQAVINPLSKPVQRLAPLLWFMRAALGADTVLLLNPQREYDSMPLKTFYRYVLPSLPAPSGASGKDGSSESGPPGPASAVFRKLPPNRVLTLGMDEPEAWLVEPVKAEYDLDNLRLGELGPGQSVAEAEYELEALLLTGMCLDLASLAARMREQVHPRGVQLQLLALSAPEGAPPLVDTLVMANLGYFQLKSRPGLWKLKLAPGRSQELYDVASSTGASSSGQRAEAAVAGANAHQVPVALTSFTGKHMHLFLRKHADRLGEDVLQAANASLAEGQAGEAGGPPAVVGSPADADDGRIHVFTVASGHMYERLQKIMILSVIKRTPARVKFWFIKNYMSPQMKAFVPFMAKKYDFDYEFVTYKWPTWLNKQTEKQRIIWAYKILFLDVLFPLGLKKVIFCDSDQVVRADLLELWNMDLGGAPYGYTPFCDNNLDMEGFRFWKQGFWKEHLQGKPYHISALYVIDLARFRQMAAGDRLRVIYDGLSKDPNSLANLDQDLPNYAQHGVPIFSLPREWLWCETWCGNETRPQAKTIDLCNNPLTKEPKLQSARRIIAEWPDLNREAVDFTAAVEAVQSGKISEEALMADQSLFHVRLQPMVEGSTWTSDQGGAAGAAAGAGGQQGGAAGGAAHDASEL